MLLRHHKCDWVARNYTVHTCTGPPVVTCTLHGPFSLHKFIDRVRKNFRIVTSRALNQALGSCVIALVSQPWSWSSRLSCPNPNLPEKGGSCGDHTRTIVRITTAGGLHVPPQIGLEKLVLFAECTCKSLVIRWLKLPSRMLTSGPNCGALNITPPLRHSVKKSPASDLEEGEQYVIEGTAHQV